MPMLNTTGPKAETESQVLEAFRQTQSWEARAGEWEYSGTNAPIDFFWRERGIVTCAVSPSAPRGNGLASRGNAAPAKSQLTRRLLPRILAMNLHYATNQPPQVPETHNGGCHSSGNDDPLCVRQRGQFGTFIAR